MDLRRLWYRLRRLTPVSLYPLLAPIHRWERRRFLRLLERADARYHADHPGTVVPGPELRFNVVGGAVDIPGFLAGGRRTADDIEGVLTGVGASVAGARRALDFGCGCGRLLIEAARRWPGVAWYGCDVDERAVRWCADHLPLTVVANQPFPPLPFPERSFDLIWCGSVFTHLDESRQDAWLAELVGRLAPGGYLLASVHGPYAWEGLPPWVVRRIRTKGFVFARTGVDEGVHPGWYQTAWHGRDYIDRHWSRFAPVVGYVPRGFGDHQDVVVVRKPV
jgi:SAM-dependent methyltransferase